MDEQKNLLGRITGWPAAFRSYVQDLQLEMRRVTWPTWKEVRGTTGVVIVAVFMFAGYFWIVDSVLGRAMRKVFDAFSK